jgi:hypothetical protein
MLVAVCGLAVMVAASAAQAQVPTNDPDVDVGFGENLIARLGEWYAVATKWRGILLDRARAMVAATQAATHIRERMEARAVGELGVLGQAIPDWRHLAQFCALDGAGTTTCAASRSLTQRFETVLPSSVFPVYAHPLFATVGSADSVLNTVLAGQHPPGATVLSALEGTLKLPSVASEPFAVVLGRRSAAVTTTAQSVQPMVDSLLHAEVNGQPVSSGRARQLTASATRAELLLELDLARTALTALEASTVDAAGHVTQYRASRYGGGPLFIW